MGEVYHVGDFADEFDFEDAAFQRTHGDAFDDGAQDLGGFCAGVRIVQRSMQCLDFAFVEFRQIGMQCGRRRRGGVNCLLQDNLLCLKILHFVQKPWCAQAIRDGFIKTIELFGDFSQIAFVLRRVLVERLRVLVGLFVECLDEFLDQVRLHQVVLEAVKHRFFDLLATYAAPVVADAFASRVSTGQIVLAGGREW